MIDASARRVQKRGLDLGATRPVLKPDYMLLLLTESLVANSQPDSEHRNLHLYRTAHVPVMTV